MKKINKNHKKKFLFHLLKASLPALDLEYRNLSSLSENNKLLEELKNEIINFKILLNKEI